MTPDTSTCQVSVANTNKKKAGQSRKKTAAGGFSIAGTLGKAAAVVIAPLLAILLLQLWPRASELLPPFERVPGETPSSADIDNQFYQRVNVWFSSGDSNGTMLNAWQYLPKDWRNTSDSRLPPVVVMAHGLGAQRDFGLHMTADVFARAGLGVLVFDYRTFGGSDGEPRHWASPSRHLQDWRAAIQYANSTEAATVWDSSRMVLWGTSYSGGHVLVMASELGSAVSGVVSQVPHLNAAAAAGASLAVRGLVPSVRLVLAGIYDAARSRLGYSPVYVRLAGLHQTTSVMALTEAEFKTYKAKHPEVKLGGWQNQILARFALEATRYSPYNYLHNITSPTLLVSASKDTLCPPAVVAQASTVLGVDVLIYPVDHFALYLTKVWADNMAQQLAFVCKVTQQDCPRDKSFQVTEIVTTIGARHREAKDKEAAAGAPQGNDKAAPTDTTTPSEPAEPVEDDGQVVDSDDEGFESA